MIYNCVSGQSWSDVVCNTYGSMDFYGKFINENNLDPEVMPISNQAVNWDEKLVVDQSIINFINNGNIKYSTYTNRIEEVDLDSIITITGNRIITITGNKVIKSN